jgi:hypothetical protein
MSFISPTLEVRWFESGTLPVRVKDWFSEDCPGELLKASEARQDIYLRIPRSEALSFKLRQSNLELKLRRAELGIRQFSEVARTAQKAVFWAGKVERWCKFSLNGSAWLNNALTGVRKEKFWVAVKKVRWQRQDQGIFYELTQLEISDRAWWSIAFEMPEQEASQIKHFENLVSRVTQNYPGSLLSADKSYAYPSWLLRQFP